MLDPRRKKSSTQKRAEGASSPRAAVWTLVGVLAVIGMVSVILFPGEYGGIVVAGFGAAIAAAYLVFGPRVERAIERLNNEANKHWWLEYVTSPIDVGVGATVIVLVILRFL